MAKKQVTKTRLVKKKRIALIKTRLAKGLNRSQIAKKAGVALSTVNKLESNFRFPQPHHIPNLAKAYGMNVKDFVDILYDGEVSKGD